MHNRLKTSTFACCGRTIEIWEYLGMLSPCELWFVGRHFSTLAQRLHATRAGAYNSCAQIPKKVQGGEHSSDAPATEEQCFIWGFYGTQYRVGLCLILECSILYKEYHRTGFNHQKNRHSEEQIMFLKAEVSNLQDKARAPPWQRQGFLSVALQPCQCT